jgi:predicted metal-dependent HD superfamily phosphohydrolase|tara:strand:- start:257 stop:499 length:243 start_codon:yes stop_codon:yes gene_type:complete
MISMKLSKEEQRQTKEYEDAVEWVKENQYNWSPRREINMLKKALKREDLYNAEELRKMKSRLRDMYIVNQQLRRMNGFGK